MEQVNGLQVYLKQIKDIPLLTAEEEKKLATAYQSGDKQAKERLVSSNLRLVVMAAKHYSTRCSMSFEDLVQEGNIGLMRATQDFDPSLGWRFSTYAMHWIKQSISRAVLNHSRTIRLPIHILELQSKYKKAYNILRDKLDKNPTAQEIAEYLEVDVKKIEKNAFVELNTNRVDGPKNVEIHKEAFSEGIYYYIDGLKLDLYYQRIKLLFYCF